MKKLHWLAVAEGLKTGNHGKRSYTIWVSCGCFTLQIDRRRFTMLWCQEKIKIIAAMYREARRRAQSLNSYYQNLDQGLVRKKIEKIPVKITGARGQYTFHVWNEIDWSEMSEIRKEKSERNEFIITILVVKLGLVHGKKTGCRRRIVIKEDLVAEDKSKLVSSRVGPSCR